MDFGKRITSNLGTAIMKLQIALSVFVLLPVSLAHAEARLNESQQLCEDRINAYKTGLERSINAKQNVDTAKAELDKINKLPATLSACERKNQIPALSSDATAQQEKEDLNDRKISR